MPIAAQTASANDCNEYGIAVQKPNFNAYGAKANIVAIDHGLACNGPIAQTQLIIFTTDSLNWIEIGYHQEYYGFSMHHEVFGEWGFWPASSHVSLYNSVTTGTTPRYKITNIPGTWNWNLYWDPNGGENYGPKIDEYDSMWGQKGWALAEVSKHGSSGSADAANDEFSIAFKKSDGSWTVWGGMDCPADVGWDTLGGWRAHIVTQYTEVETQQTPGYCIG